jgi:hypothetical protein
MSELPLEQSTFPGVYRRGGRQRKETAATFAEAREIKLARDSNSRAERRGPTLHSYALAWPDRYAGSGRDSLREATRREYGRLLTTFAFRYFDRDLRLRDLDTGAVQRFVAWLTNLPGRRGRLSDRSIGNALTPLRLALDAAVAEGILERNPAQSVVGRVGGTAAPGSSPSDASSPARSWRACSPRSRRSGGPSSSSSRQPACGSRRLLGFAGLTSSWTRNERICA